MKYFKRNIGRILLVCCLSLQIGCAGGIEGTGSVTPLTDADEDIVRTMLVFCDSELSQADNGSQNIVACSANQAPATQSTNGTYTVTIGVDAIGRSLIGPGS